MLIAALIAFYTVVLLTIALAWASVGGAELPCAWDVKNRVLRTAYTWSMVLAFGPFMVILLVFCVLLDAVVGGAREARRTFEDITSGIGNLGRLLIGREAR